MKIMKIKCKGTRPLLVHNVRLANPLDPVTQKIKGVSGKRKKTLDDHELLAQLEFEGGLYIDDEIGPYLPGDQFHSALIASAKRDKLGTKARGGLLIEEEKVPLSYKGPRTAKDLWKAGFYDQRMVVVQRARTLRTRPLFREWQCDVTVIYSPTDFDPADVERIAKRAGAECGVGTYRPRFGIFDVSVQ